MMTRLASPLVLALGLAACSPSSPRPTTRVEEPLPPVAAPGGMSVAEARTIASGHSFLRPGQDDSYEVLYFDAGGRASILRADQMKIVHGRWTADTAPVAGSPEPISAICLTLLGGDATAPRRCLDPKLLAAADTERAKGDVLGIAKWDSVPDALPRERATLSELRERIRG